MDIFVTHNTYLRGCQALDIKRLRKQVYGLGKILMERMQGDPILQETQKTWVDCSLKSVWSFLHTSFNVYDGRYRHENEAREDMLALNDFTHRVIALGPLQWEHASCTEPVYPRWWRDQQQMATVLTTHRGYLKYCGFADSVMKRLRIYCGPHVSLKNYINATFGGSPRSLGWGVGLLTLIENEMNRAAVPPVTNKYSIFSDSLTKVIYVPYRGFFNAG